MSRLRLTIRPLSAFGTPLAGDTLFGQLCWAARERFGQSRLGELLSGYVEGRPFAVISDGFPSGFVPRPTLPECVLDRVVDPALRKEARRRVWMPLGKAGLPLSEWLDLAQASLYPRGTVLTQNTINRLTGTTGTGPFAPRQVDRLAFGVDAHVDIHVVLDEARLHPDALLQLMEDLGATGFGRDATTGLGKFVIESVEPQEWSDTPARHFMTLAPCAPVPEALDAANCFYQPLTRFGRHGNIAVLSGQPFKRPILMLRTAAILTTRGAGQFAYHGSGIGGEARPISAAMPQTVHQGYAPLVPLNVELRK